MSVNDSRLAPVRAGDLLQKVPSDWYSHRYQLSNEDIDDVIHDLVHQIAKRVRGKGRGILISRHEIIGILDEELMEIKEVSHRTKTGADMRPELLDLAVAAIFGAASIDSGKLDW